MVLTRFYWPVFLFSLSSCSFDFINDSQEEATKDPVYTYRGSIKLDYKQNSTKVLNLDYNIFQYPAYIIENEVGPDSFVISFSHLGQILPEIYKSTRAGGCFGSVPLDFYNEIPPPISFTLHISDKWHKDSIEVLIPILENIQKLNPKILNATLDSSKNENTIRKIDLEIDPGIPVQIRQEMELFKFSPSSFGGWLDGIDVEKYRKSESFFILNPNQDKCQTRVFFDGKPFASLTGLSSLYFYYRKQIVVPGPQNYNQQPFIDMKVEIEFN